MITKAKRVLLAEKILEDVRYRQELGVPITRIIIDLNLAISRSALLNLLSCYSFYIANKDNKALKSNLFPKWMDHKSKKVQSQPENWSYNGRFPWGEWINPEDKSI